MNCNFRLTYETGGGERVLTAPSVGGELILTVTDDGERRRVTAKAVAPVRLRAYS